MRIGGEAMKRLWIGALAGAMVLLTGVGGFVEAAEPMSVSATFDGAPISLQEARDLSCHDFDFPILRCFATAAILETEVAKRVQVRAAVGLAPLLGDGYVTVYEHALYAGSALTLSADQPWLSSVGWNDRISSFKSFGAAGNFRDDSPGGGFIYGYGATTQVSALSGTYNDKFSAFNIN
jgi:hypothetical protein